jgi:curved DNA-binding protein CbpA
VSDDPFGVLGLPRQAALSDDDVRAAWRRIAAATHPDRDDGGDPAFFGAAAAAYATLRTAYGRGEALADLAELAAGQLGGGARARAGERHGARARSRPGDAGRHGVREGGRLGVLVLRVVGAAAASAVAFAVAGPAPASVGVLAGALTWLVATGRHDFP